MEKSTMTLEQMKADIKLMIEAYDKGYMTWRKIKKKLMEMIADDERTVNEVVTSNE